MREKTQPDPWGGKLHQVMETPFPGVFCFECGDEIKKDDYVHVHFGGMVIIHCKCSHGQAEELTIECHSVVNPAPFAC